MVDRTLAHHMRATRFGAGSWPAFSAVAISDRVLR
jgi:hypothetical protein